MLTAPGMTGIVLIRQGPFVLVHGEIRPPGLIVPMAGGLNGPVAEESACGSTLSDLKPAPRLEIAAFSDYFNR